MVNKYLSGLLYKGFYEGDWIGGLIGQLEFAGRGRKGEGFSIVQDIGFSLGGSQGQSFPFHEHQQMATAFGVEADGAGQRDAVDGIEMFGMGGQEFEFMMRIGS